MDAQLAETPWLLNGGSDRGGTCSGRRAAAHTVTHTHTTPADPCDQQPKVITVIVAACGVISSPRRATATQNRQNDKLAQNAAIIFFNYTDASRDYCLTPELVWGKTH